MPANARSAVAGLLLVAAFASSAVADDVRLERGTDGLLRLAGLPPLFENEDVARQLGTGLTTTFAFRVDLPGSGGQAVGGARAEVRFALWDEVFHVAAAGIDGNVRRQILASREELQAWWSDLALPILDGRSAVVARATEARVLLEVVPFSRAEQDDTQRWFAHGADAATATGERFADSPDDREGSLEQVFGVLIATSIQRRALISHRWTLRLPEPTR
jgi:hypothetical protein